MPGHVGAWLAHLRNAQCTVQRGLVRGREEAIPLVARRPADTRMRRGRQRPRRLRVRGQVELRCSVVHLCQRLAQLPAQRPQQDHLRERLEGHC